MVYERANLRAVKVTVHIVYSILGMAVGQSENYVTIEKFRVPRTCPPSVVKTEEMMAGKVPRSSLS